MKNLFKNIAKFIEEHHMIIDVTMNATATMMTIAFVCMVNDIYTTFNLAGGLSVLVLWVVVGTMVSIVFTDNLSKYIDSILSKFSEKETEETRAHFITVD